MGNFLMLAYDPTPDAFPPPFCEAERSMAFRSSDRAVLEHAARVLRAAGARVSVIQQERR